MTPDETIAHLRAELEAVLRDAPTPPAFPGVRGGVRISPETKSDLRAADVLILQAASLARDASARLESLYPNVAAVLDEIADRLRAQHERIV